MHLQTPKISLSRSSFIDSLPTIVKLSTSKPFFGHRKFASVLSCLCNTWCVCVVICLCAENNFDEISRRNSWPANTMTGVSKGIGGNSGFLLFQAKHVDNWKFLSFFYQLERSINGTPTQHQGNRIWLSNHARYTLRCIEN